MRAWLKDKLRRWLFPDEAIEESTDDPTIDCLVDGEIVTVRITGVCGPYLRGIRVDGKGEHIVMETAAMDRKWFWQLWQRFAGNPTIEWE